MIIGILSVFITPKSPSLIQPVQAKSTSKYGLVRKFVIPKKWRGKWYKAYNKGSFSSINLYKHGIKAQSSYDNYIHSKGVYNPLWVIGKIRGTNKYPWQMSTDWVAKHSKNYESQYAGHWVQRFGKRWLVETSPLTKVGEIADYRFLLLHHFKASGKKYRALLGAGEETNSAYFRTKKQAKRFKEYQFKSIKRPLS